MNKDTMPIDEQIYYAEQCIRLIIRDIQWEWENRHEPFMKTRGRTPLESVRQSRSQTKWYRDRINTLKAPAKPDEDS